MFYKRLDKCNNIVPYLVMKALTDIQVRFWKHVDKQEDCWLWTGNSFSVGYGLFSNTTVSKYAHRASYEFTVGEIPKGMQLHHTCYQKLCVNPAHLVLTTLSDHRKVYHTSSATKTEKKVMTTLRLPLTVKMMLNVLSDEMGMSQASVIEVAVRDLQAHYLNTKRETLTDDIAF